MLMVPLSPKRSTSSPRALGASLVLAASLPALSVSSAPQKPAVTKSNSPAPTTLMLKSAAPAKTTQSVVKVIPPPNASPTPGSPLVVTQRVVFLVRDRGSWRTLNRLPSELIEKPAPTNSAPEGTLDWFDRKFSGATSWMANLLEIGTGLAVAAAGYLGLKSYRANPQCIITESLLINDAPPAKNRRSPPFLHVPNKRVSEMFPDWFERFIVDAATKKATERFPLVYINPEKNPEIASRFRDDFFAKDALEVMAEVGQGRQPKADVDSWHLVVVARKSYEGDTPVIRRDFFSFAYMVRMLENPIPFFSRLKGENKRRIMYHLEEAALVAYLEPRVARRAIREEARLNEEPLDAKTFRARYRTIVRNSRALLRLLLISSEGSINVLDQAVREQSLQSLEKIGSIAEVNTIIEERMKPNTIAQRCAEPLLHYFWRRNTVKDEWLASRVRPKDLGLFHFFGIAEMVSTHDTKSQPKDTA